MGTRSLTFVYDGKQPIINMYRQYDGYPSGHGKDLYNFLKGKKIVNGLNGKDSNVFNGAGCLAASLVSDFKRTHGNSDYNFAGGIYLHSVKDVDCGQDYEYHIYVIDDSIEIKVISYGDTEFNGTLDEFNAWIESKDEG